jgi:hypothetical protein
MPAVRARNTNFVLWLGYTLHKHRQYRSFVDFPALLVEKNLKCLFVDKFRHQQAPE